MDEKTRFPQLTRRVAFAAAIAGVSIMLPSASPLNAAERSPGLVEIETEELVPRASSQDSVAADRSKVSQLPLLPKAGRTESIRSTKRTALPTSDTLADLVRSELSMVPMIRSVEKSASDALTAPVKLEVAPRVRRIPLGGFGKRAPVQAIDGTANQQPDRVVVQYADPMTPPKVINSQVSENLQPRRPEVSTGGSFDVMRFDIRSIPAPPTRLTHASTRPIEATVGKEPLKSNAGGSHSLSAKTAEVKLLSPFEARPVEARSKGLAGRRISDLLQWDVQDVLRR